MTDKNSSYLSVSPKLPCDETAVAKVEHLAWLHKDVRLQKPDKWMRSYAWWLTQATWRLAPYTVLPIFIALYSSWWLTSCMFFGNFFGFLGWSAYFHNYVLFNQLAQSLLWLPLTLCVGTTGLFTIQPLILRELFNRFPRTIGATSDGLVLQCLDRAVTIQWSSIRNVEQVNLKLKGTLSVCAIKLELENEPSLRNRSERSAWLRTSGLHNSVLYLDSSGRLPDDRCYPSVWIPLEMIGTEDERERLLSTIRSNIDSSRIDASLPSAHCIGPSISSFTQMWLHELKHADRSGVLPAGQTLCRQRYQIEKQIGAGGFSVVYHAIDLALGGTDKPVAIKEYILKVPGSGASIEPRIASVMAEVELLKSLNHPAIVKVLDCFAEAGRMYVVLEAFDGPTLRERVMTKPLTYCELVEFSLQCCVILHYLHGHEPPVFHRDLAPDNFIVTTNGIKLIDFNISVVGARSESTLVVGKHCYMAPEQFLGTANQSSDLYQLGATLYYVATGCDPEPLSVSEIGPHRVDVSREFCAIVEKLTRQRSEDRFADINEVEERLSRLMAPASEQATAVCTD